MAIIKCPECGQSVSEHAANCPKCGCPINGNIEHCPDCDELVLKSYTECPKCHCPLNFEKENSNMADDHLLRKAKEAFDNGKYTEAADFVDKALSAEADNVEGLELQKQIKIKLQNMEQKYVEAKHLFEDEHQLYSALALVNKLIAIESLVKYTELKEQIVAAVVKDLVEKSQALFKNKKYDLAQSSMAKALSYDPENDEIKARKESLDIKIEKKRRVHKNIVIGFVIGIIVVVLAISGVIVYNIQAENAAWENLQTSTNLNDFQQYLAEYPHGRHRAEVEGLYKKLSTELTDWATVSNSVDKYAVKTFLDKYPNGVCAVQAKSRLDSLSWVDACNINKPEAYAQYIAEFPNGKYASIAQEKTSQLKDAQVSSDENSQITGVISQFFDGIASQDEDKLLSSVEPTLTTFLNKRNATKAHVIAFMKQMHASDMNSIAFSVNRGVKIVKKQLSDGESSYDVTCSIDEKIDRSEAGKETFVNYGANLTIDNFMKISSLKLRKISSY